MQSRKMACESERCSAVSDSVTPWNSPGQNAGVGSCSLLQGIFPTQGSNPGIPHCRQILCQLSHKGSPRILKWVASPSFRGSPHLPNPGIKPRYPALHVDYLPSESPGKPKNTGEGSLSPRSPGDLPDPGIERGSPSLQVDSLQTELLGQPSCPWGIFKSLIKYVAFLVRRM